MDQQKAPHRVRAARLACGFTQGEMARLLGYRFDEQVSRVERGFRCPSLHFLIGSTILFGRSIEDLFKGLYDKVEEHVVREAYALHTELAKQDTLAARKRCELLATVISNAAKRHRNNQKNENDVS